MLNTQDIDEIQKMVQAQIDKLETFSPSLKYHISPWLIKEVIICYKKWRYEAKSN